MKNKGKGISRPWFLVLFGSIGSIAPEIVLFYSKRFSMENLTFHFWQYVFVSLFYFSLAGLVAGIFPYGNRPTLWKAFSLGIALPLIISTAATFFTGHEIVPRGGGDIQGRIIDLLALF